METLWGLKVYLSWVEVLVWFPSVRPSPSVRQRRRDRSRIRRSLWPSHPASEYQRCLKVPPSTAEMGREREGKQREWSQSWKDPKLYASSPQQVGGGGCSGPHLKLLPRTPITFQRRDTRKVSEVGTQTHTTKEFAWMNLQIFVLRIKMVLKGTGKKKSKSCKNRFNMSGTEHSYILVRYWVSRLV